MKHIRNLWNLLKQEISLWKYEKQELVKGICYIVMIAWLFFDLSLIHISEPTRH